MVIKKKIKKVKSRRPIRRQAKGRGNGVLSLFAIALISLAVFNVMLASFMALVMAPTAILMLTERSPWRSNKIMCVGSLNLASTLPWVPALWNNQNLFGEMVSDMVTMSIALGGAVVGHGLLFFGPIIAAMILQAFSSDKMKKIASERAALVEQWGPEVLGNDKSSKSEQNFIIPKKA